MPGEGCLVILRENGSMIRERRAKKCQLIVKRERAKEERKSRELKFVCTSDRVAIRLKMWLLRWRRLTATATRNKVGIRKFLMRVKLKD